MIDAPVRTRTVPFRGEEVGVLETGPADAPPLGYLHGMLGNVGPPPFLEALAAATGRRVVAPCLPGFAPSPPNPELREFYDWIAAASEIVTAAGLGGAPIVASSIGAMLALELAAIRPDAFSAVVAISPFGLWDEDAPIADLFAARLKDQPAMLARDPDRLASFFEDPGGSVVDADGLVTAELNRYLSRRVAASLVWPIPERGIVSRLHLVTCPVGVIWGSADQIIPSPYRPMWADALPLCCGSVVIAGAGHCVEWDEPDEVARAVCELLQSGDSSRGGCG